MSYPKGAKGDHPAHPQGPGPGQRPSFDRPSLFAGMEDDDASEDTRRVRILSTLESTRQASRPGRTQGGRRTGKARRNGWLQGALWGVLGMGVLALMAGFVMVIQDSRPALAHATLPTTAPVTKVAREAGLPTSGTLPATAAGPAVIETTPAHAAPLAVLEPQPAPPTDPASSALPAVAPPQLDTTLASNQASTAARANQTTAPAPVAKPAAKPSTTSAPKGQDEDVALLEAMFAHTGRKAAASRPASARH